MCRDKGLPISTWCFQEVLKTDLNASSWMDPAFIERKRASVPAQLFRVEYELGEPDGGSRGFDLTLFNKAFTQMDTVSERHSSDDDEWVFEEPQASGWYAIGADWAKEKDKPWPEMAAMFNDVLNRYQAVSAHDGTGIGNVVNDLIDERAHKFVMVGRARTQLLVEYTTAVEHGVYRLPANTPAFAAHKGTTVEEVYAPGKWNSHLSDDVAAFALAHNAWSTKPASRTTQASFAPRRSLRRSFPSRLPPPRPAHASAARSPPTRPPPRAHPATPRPPSGPATLRSSRHAPPQGAPKSSSPYDAAYAAHRRHRSGPDGSIPAAAPTPDESGQLAPPASPAHHH